jgi:hypothetical protein
MRRVVIGRHRKNTRSLNRRRAIRHHCLACSNFDWDAAVKCGRSDCSLHPFRRGSAGAGGEYAEMRKEAIRRFCLTCIAAGEKNPTDCSATECALFDYKGVKP